MADYLLPSERRRRPPAPNNTHAASSSSSKRPPRAAAQDPTAAAASNRSVRSLRAQWELAGNSVPPAPLRALKHSGKTELAKYLSHKQAAQARQQAQLSSSPPRSLKDRASNASGLHADRNDDKGVNSLISRFNHTNNNVANRFPLAERDLFAPRFDDSIHSSDSTTADTFGELSTDHPKTDPGQLENFRRAIQNIPNPNISNVAEVPVTSQQITRETKAFALAQSNSKHMLVPSLRRSLSAMGVNELAAKHTEVLYNYPAETNENGSDWGAYDKRIQELFAEAQTTAEKAVQCDENEEYGQALDLYVAVVKLYYKVMPFLDPEEALEVDGTVKMYSKRCEVIQQAFQDEEDYVDESDALNMGTRVVEREPIHHKQAQSNADSSTPTHHDHHHQVHETGNTNTHNRDLPANDNHRQGSRLKNQSGLPPTAPKPSTQENDVALMRNKLPDYDLNEAGGTVQDAPRGLYANNAAAAAQHRTSLSRPVSKTAIRKATQSMSRERVTEIEEKMRVMRTALHTFTVKRKHLGPARALELMLTTLNVKTFGEMKRLEPLPREAIKTWQSQLEVLLGMLEEIKEDQGHGYKLRNDISDNLPKLKRCDTVVQETMASFSCLKGEISYVDAENRTHSSSRRNNAEGNNTKWWVKHPVVKAGGLSEKLRRTIEVAQKDMETVFKTAHEVNYEVIRLMAIPTTFMDGLPRHARQIISKDLKEGLMTWSMFRIEDFMKEKKMYNKETAKDLCSALEKVALVWESKTIVKSFLSRTLDTLDIRGERGKNVINALRRCQNAIRDLRRAFPTMGASDLDTAKIAKNEDIGLAGLEAYSRALESRAYRVLTRLREILEVDDEEKNKNTR